ncbi:MAG TPA: M23 family metallopeptidase [Salinimicrobium sp.]|nr:M23 family metallopeptidase [Salinimicrobium sp.]
MSEKKSAKKTITKKLLHKYRLVILNEDTFEERLSFKLTKLNIFVVVTLSAILLIAGTTVLIAFTPLREYIPGYSSTKLRNQAVELAEQTDSIQNVLRLNTQYYNSIKQVLTGDMKSVEFNRDSILEAQRLDPSLIDFDPSKEDSLLREQVALEDKYNLLETATSRSNFAFFPPLTGSISEGYSIKNRHYAVDIAAETGAAVKAAADGVVIFAEWSAQTGNVLILEHSYGLISVYKHNATLLKEQGDLVKSGEVIATVGSTGEYTTGPHLHFELWSDGQPIDPTDFIDFNF